MPSIVSCPHFPGCCGCSLIGVAYSEQLKMKLRAVRALFKQAGLKGFHADSIRDIRLSPNQGAYRNRAKLVPGRTLSSHPSCSPASAGTGHPRLGLYREGSHEVIDIPGCPVHMEGINRSIEVIRSGMAQYDVSLYDEETDIGDLRFVSVRQGLATGEILVGFVTRSAECAGSTALAKHVIAECGGVVGVVQNINPEKGNVIFGRLNQVLAGRGYLEEVIGGMRLRLGLTSFFQVNTAVAEKAYQAIIDHLEFAEHDTLLDLYCGVGAIGLVAASRVGRVIGIEEAREAVYLAKATTRANAITNGEFRIGRVEDQLTKVVGELHGRGVTGERLCIVINPPRKGVDARVIDILGHAMPSRIAYLSCSPTTLIRDLGRLSQGGYRVRHVELFDMFPQTDQVETLAILESEEEDPDRPIRRAGRGTRLTTGEARGYGLSVVAELISEHITPHPGTFDVARMGRGEPGLPGGFEWRGCLVDVVEVLGAWKESSREGGRTGGDLYLRRHYYRLRMSDERVWTVYFERQTPKSGNPKKRWFLYTVEDP